MPASAPLTSLPSITLLSTILSASASFCGMTFSFAGIPVISSQGGRRSSPSSSSSSSSPYYPHSPGDKKKTDGGETVKTQILLDQFHHIYVIGATAMPPLAGVATLGHLYSSYLSYHGGLTTTRWIASSVAAALTIGIVPFTLFVIFPVNKKLEDARMGVKGKELTAEKARETLEVWKWLNFARAAMPLFGAGFGVWGLLEMFA